MNSRGSSLISIASLLFITLSLALAGCERNGKSTGEKSTLSFWHFWSEPAQKQALLGQIRQFENEHPDIHVELSELSWNDGKTKLLAAFNSNTAPDVLEL